MLLQRLVAMPRDEDDSVPAFYRDRPMRWRLSLTQEGSLASRSLVDLTRPDDKPGTGKRFPVPYTTRTSGVAACLGADDVQYVLGWCDEDSKPDRVTECHAALVDLVREWAEQAVDDPAAMALSQFYATGRTSQITRPEGWTSKQSVLVFVGGHPITESPSLQRFWAAEVERRKSGGGTGTSRRGLCLVCGNRDAGLLDTLPQQLSRQLVPRASQNVALVSANKRIHTYDFSESLTTVPICIDCGSRAVDNLSAALADSDRSMTYGGDSRLVWWTIGDTHFDLNAVISADDPDTVRGLVAVIHKESRHRPNGLDSEQRFCALTVSGNVSRVMIQDWVDMPLAALETNIGRWFADHEITSSYADRGPYYPLIGLVRAAGRWVPGRNGESGRYADLGAKNSRRPDGLSRHLLRAALLGVPLPGSLLAHVVTRIRTDSRIDDARAALLRLILTRSPYHATEDVMPGLDPENRDPAYLSGRILATLESIQYNTVRHSRNKDEDKGLNTTFVDRYFAGAVANPRVALIQGRQVATAWLKKIRRDNPGTAYALDRRLTELFDLFDAAAGLPGRIGLNQQATFILGYHHQRADNMRSRASKPVHGTDVPEVDHPPVPA